MKIKETKEIISSTNIPDYRAIITYIDMLKIENMVEFIKRMHDALLWKIEDK